MRKTKFIVLLTIGSLLTFGLSGCKDYDADIDDLNKKISEVEAKIATSATELKTQLMDWVNGEKFLKKVTSDITKSADGNSFTIKFSDGSELVYEPKYPEPAPIAVEWKPAATAGDPDTLWIDGQNTKIPFPKEPAPEHTFGQDPVSGNLTFDGEDTGVPYPTLPGTPPTIPPVTGLLMMEVNNTTQHWDFYEVDADGVKPATPSYSIPFPSGGSGGSGGGGGITSIVFVPEFTLDGKPAVYVTAISVDTLAANAAGDCDWAATGRPDGTDWTATDTIYGRLKLQFKVNGSGLTDGSVIGVKLLGTQLTELRSFNGEAPDINEYPLKNDGKDYKFDGKVLTITVPPAFLDTFSIQRPATARDLAPYLAVEVNGNLLSSYIPYVQDVIPTHQILLGERRQSGKYVRYGMQLETFAGDVESTTFKDSVSILDPGTYTAKVEPVLFYQKTAGKALVLRGFEEYTTFSFALDATKQGANYGGIVGQEVYDFQVATDGLSATVKPKSTAKQDSMFSANRDYIGVKVTFNLTKAVSASGVLAQDRKLGSPSRLDSTLRGATDGSWTHNANYADVSWGNALVKVLGDKYFDSKVTGNVAHPLGVFYQGQDTIVDGTSSSKGVLLAQPLLVLDTASLSRNTNYFVDGSVPSATFGANLLGLRTIEVSGEGTADSDTTSITILNIAGKVDGATTNASQAHRLIVGNKTKPGKYTITWSVKHPDVKGINFVSKFTVEIKNPKVKLTKNSAVWEDGKFAIYGDTIYDQPGLAGGAFNNDGKWLMAGNIWSAVDTTENKATFDYEGALPACGVAFADSALDKRSAWTFAFKTAGDTTHATNRVSFRAWDDATGKIDTAAIYGTDSLLVLGTSGIASATTNKFLPGGDPVKLTVKAKVSGIDFDTYLTDNSNSGEFDAIFKNPIIWDQPNKPLTYSVDIDGGTSMAVGPTTDRDAIKNRLVGDIIVFKNTRPGYDDNIAYKKELSGSDRYDGNNFVKYFSGGNAGPFGGTNVGNISFWNAPTFSWDISALMAGEKNGKTGEVISTPTVKTTWGQEISIPIEIYVTPAP